MTETRTESDTMGEMTLPAAALWGAQTQRAVENFPVSGRPLPPAIVHALGSVKLAAARVNRDLGLLDPDIAGAIETAAAAVAAGEHDDQFPIDVFQTGSGTSSNMNANEVIGTLASRALGRRVHPNDHVNLGQSSNDVIPTVLHVAAVLGIEGRLLPALRHLQASLAAKAEEFDSVVKIGRTHLMDAVPIRLGQEFSGYARQIELAIARVEAALPGLRELAIGGTAVGTGLNTHAEFGARVAAELSALSGTGFVEAANHFEAQGARDAYVFAAGALTTLAASLMKIANDIRLLASGPQAGLGELVLPAIQPGSSIMPGKVNPVISESVIQVGAQVTGNCQAIAIGGQWGQLDLNVMLPMMARNMIESIDLLANASRLFVDKCLAGTVANVERAEGYVERSIAMATALNPHIGYEAAAAIAKKSYATGRTVREIAYEETGLSREQVDEILHPHKQTIPGTGAGQAAGG
ncbi:MAG: Fumarate hydratase class II [uncultured Thermomicrobiales bacterium]|uniref:Fumarate hydratase class II n=1 Tax=uncultured Thermomicrobiales bacterium TaxID=1645740 RepID=A0A6J4VBC5_9BACT|nr:MAG: Fumarate hydratase class II [uncultured Thermomicrobiales bacterium]